MLHAAISIAKNFSHRFQIEVLNWNGECFLYIIYKTVV